MNNQEDYGKWSLRRLIAELKRRNVPSSGRKSELVDRLKITLRCQ